VIKLFPEAPKPDAEHSAHVISGTPVRWLYDNILQTFQLASDPRRFTFTPIPQHARTSSFLRFPFSPSPLV